MFVKEYQNPEVLRRLYWEEGLSLDKIAKRFGVSEPLIFHWMKAFDIPRREPLKLIDRKALLTDLYTDKKLSSRKIADVLKLNDRYVRKLLKKHGIKTRSLSEIRTKYPKTSFSGNLVEKSYILGLRTGDIHAKRIHKIIRIQTTTTHPLMVELIKNVFSKYSHVGEWTFYNKSFQSHEIFVYCDLGESFKFLLEKPDKIPEWILNDIELFYSFLAGYMDSEGTWLLLKNHENSIKFVFRIKSTDKEVLSQINEKLREFGFTSYFDLEFEKGEHMGKKLNKDMYYLYLQRKQDVINIAKILLKFSHHKEKILKMNLILESSDKTWNEVEDDLLKLRGYIKGTRLTREVNMQQLTQQIIKIPYSLP